MKSFQSRRMFKFSTAGNVEVRDLFQAVFAAELMFPSLCLWMVSPWISDVPMVDNATGAFNSLQPGWGRRSIGLAELLGNLVRLGSYLVVVTKPLDHNDRFIRILKASVKDAGLQKRLKVSTSHDLHLKGFLGDRFYISGSMNFTHSGVEILEEGVTFDVDPDIVGQAQLNFYHQFGGKLR